MSIGRDIFCFLTVLLFMSLQIMGCTHDASDSTPLTLSAFLSLLQRQKQPVMLFHSNRDGDFDIYMMDDNGSNPGNLTNTTDNAGNDSSPAMGLSYR